MKPVLVFSLLSSCVFFACSKEEATKPIVEGQLAPAVVPTTAIEPTGIEEQAIVTSVTSIKREPSEVAKIDGPGGKKLNNWIATLYRGEEVTVLKIQDEWAQVKTSDEKEGWIKKEGLLPSEGTSMATVFETVKTFNRPDLLALNASRTIEPGSLLVVVKTKDQFSEVNYQSKQTAWVLSEKLNVDGTEIAAAKLVNKIRWLKLKKDPTADQFLELAKTQFSSSRLVSIFDEAAKPDAQPSDTTPPTAAP